MSAHVTVFGAGAFGGWTALALVRRGARVTLIDAWGPGNVRSSSGGETRVIRATYGARPIYTRMAARALELWRAHDRQWQRGFYRKTGVLWMFGREDRFAADSLATLRAERVAVEELTIAAARGRYPQIDFDGIRSAFLEPDAGYLLARRACEHVVERFVMDGGEYRVAAAASPVRIDGTGEVERIPLRGGDNAEADAFVFTCGPWLGTLFPDAVGSLVTSTRQEVYYFGTSAGDTQFSEERLPAWIEVGSPVLYGVPGNAHRGIKIADDTPGEPFDPTDGDRSATTTRVANARRFLARRFPALASAPLVGAEVCQYESTPDANFIVDRHPAAANVWIVGGGSGHGFKMGPAIGEIVAALVLDGAQPDRAFGLARFAAPPAAGWQEKWL
jgi:glycine/D-amino acid oxidase-like deaminating enzyme